MHVNPPEKTENNYQTKARDVHGLVMRSKSHQFAPVTLNSSCACNHLCVTIEKNKKFRRACSCRIRMHVVGLLPRCNRALLLQTSGLLTDAALKVIRFKLFNSLSLF